MLGECWCLPLSCQDERGRVRAPTGSIGDDRQKDPPKSERGLHNLWGFHVGIRPRPSLC